MISAWNIFWSIFRQIVGNGSDKCTLGQVGNLGSRDERVKLCANGGGYILTVDGDRLPLLEYFAETFGKRLRSFSNHLTAENIAYRVWMTFDSFHRNRGSTG